MEGNNNKSENIKYMKLKEENVFMIADKIN
jgi:hypothetical protein